MDKLITAAQAAARLGVSRQYVIYLLKRGRIPAAQKVGKQWVLPEGATITPPAPRRLIATEIPPDRKKAGKR